ncbi:MAG: hypothetical protein LRY27_02650 [Chitinophagales bacterium]|nr:hypothetical protein [Chitinophagales bacterium]
MLFSLYKNVIDKADFKLAEIPPNYFIDFKESLGNDFQIRAYSYQGQMMGFISYFIGKDTLHINFVGLDYTMNKDLCVYQRILYDCIEQGILLSKKEIHFGRTATEIKTAVGAEPHKVFAYLKHVSTIPNLAIKPLTTYLKPETFEARNPFKSA